MKRLIAALGIATVLAAAGPVHAQTAFTLLTSAQNWCDESTWVLADTTCPGDNSGDTASFSAAAGKTVNVDSSPTYATSTANDSVIINFLNTGVLTLTTTPFSVSPDVAAATVTLTESGSTDAHLLSISGALTITGGSTAGYHAGFTLNAPDLTAGSTTLDASASVDSDATFTLTASGAFDPGDLYLDGGDPTSTGQALFDMNGGTLTAPDSMTMRGDSKFDAAGAVTNLTWSGVVVTAEATTNAYETVAEIVMGFNKTLTVGQLTLTGGTDAGDTVTFKVTGGTFSAQ